MLDGAVHAKLNCALPGDADNAVGAPGTDAAAADPALLITAAMATETTATIATDRRAWARQAFMVFVGQVNERKADNDSPAA